MKFYSVTYKENNGSLSLSEVYPKSEYVETMFWNGTLLYNVQVGDEGKFRLDFWLDEDTGEIEIEAKFKYRGWCEVDV